jgi:alkylation response protein AidB-like acyl-CoA dehydrogenase
VIEGAELELLERSLRQAVESQSGATLDHALVELGWADALDADPRVAVSLLFALQGASSATSSAIGRVVGGIVAPDSAAMGVVLPPLGSCEPPARAVGDHVEVRGIGTVGLATHDNALIVAQRGDGDAIAVLVPTNELTTRPVRGIDPALGLVEVTAPHIDLDGPLVTASSWTDAVARAQLAIGHEMVGASRTMLTLARDHALERIQFGQPIARFQAVRHRLADTLVAIETAEAALDAGWLDGTALSAAMAKALAGRSARTAARHCQQVLAGIGFTTEHDLHRYIRRVFVLDELFGPSRSLTRELGDHLLTTRRLPPLLPL